jgi:serine/threonine protein kinase
MWLHYNIGAKVQPEDVEGYFGFVYLITHNQTGKKYVGKKFFTKAKTKMVKGKKKKLRVDSGWMDYWSSSETLKEEVKLKGEDQYTREILHLCKSRSECSYWETYEIFSRHALLSDGYYNEWVSARIRASHLKGLQIQVSGNTSVSF